jgi:hypothetical protein
VFTARYALSPYIKQTRFVSNTVCMCSIHCIFVYKEYCDKIHGVHNIKFAKFKSGILCACNSISCWCKEFEGGRRFV